MDKQSPPCYLWLKEWGGPKRIPYDCGIVNSFPFNPSAKRFGHDEMEPKSSTHVASTCIISARFRRGKLFVKIFRAILASGRVREVSEC